MKIKTNKKIILLSLLFLIFTFSFFLIGNAYAAKDSGGLVPCGSGSEYNDRCTLCDLIVGIRDITNWGRTILIIVALTAIVIGGFMYIISMGDKGKMESAKGIITQALWGVVIVLGAWLIVNTVLWLLAKKNDLGVGVSDWSTFQCESSSGSTSGSIDVVSRPPNADGSCDPGYHLSTSGNLCFEDEEGADTGNEGTDEETIPKECEPYKDAFEQASAGDKNMKCLMVGVAMSESTCNPNAQKGSGCGLMQIEGGDCEYWKSHPTESVAKAAQMMKDNAAALEKYKSKFDIGNKISQDNKTVMYGANIYDTGNDDLIASYNGGPGSGTTADGKKQPFAVSEDCPDPPTPAWQCHIKATGFSGTQTYVKNVQKYQDNCLGK